MNKRKQFLDEAVKLNAKFRNKSYIEKTSAKLLAYYSDIDKNIRKSENLCKYCYYVFPDRIGGSVITTVICANCDEELSFSNTATDILCNSCANELKSCKHCGQKMD